MGKAVKKKSVPKENFSQRMLKTIIGKINFNSILLAVIAGYFTYTSQKMSGKQDTSLLKQDTAAVKSNSFRQRSDSIHALLFDRIDHLYKDNIYQDSVLHIHHQHQ